MSYKDKDSSALHAKGKRDSSGSGDRRRSAASGDGETGGERRVSRGSGGSAEQPSASLLGTGKKVLFSEPVTVQEPHRLSQTGPRLEHQTSQGEEGSPKSQKKIVSTWRMACGMTKDKTKDLLKRWRTLPDQGNERPPLQELKSNTGDHGWSVHVWATWVKRCPSDDEPCDAAEAGRGKSCVLTDTQRDKLAYFFAHVFDMDRDDVISLQDFEGFAEVDHCFVHPFVLRNANEFMDDHKDFTETLSDVLNLNDCPDVAGSETSSDRYGEWLLENPETSGVGRILMKEEKGYEIEAFRRMVGELGRILDITTGTGCINKEELGAFYSSVLSYPPQKLSALVNEAYSAMTASGDYKLNYDSYRLVFANFLFGRYPNGPGQFVFGAAQKSPLASFPIDYTAMNSPPEDIEPFNGSLRSNRSSVIV